MERNFVLRNRIREVRMSRNLTEAQLGDYVGASEKAIETFENGLYIPSARMALAMCMALDCTFEDLFYSEEPKSL